MKIKMETSLLRRGKLSRSMSAINLPSLKLPAGAKFWKKRSANISEYDPSFRAIYLGNVLTSWAKGDGCADKPLATLWKNYSGTEKPNILMKVTVCASGLKAVTKEHGLTEYWANRITFCDADPDYPKVFCWIYRHEGRKMKQELRCHAVLCPSETKARLMCKRLRERLHQALVDFKKEKISRQNARLSLANATYENPSMPYRKILLQTGSANYRPPMERGKSAPKLKVIEESILEEDEELEMSEAAAYPSTFRHPAELRHNSESSFDEDSMSNVDAISVASTVFHDTSNSAAVSNNPRARDYTVLREIASDKEVSGENSDEDEVTDYLQELQIDVDSATASLSPESGRQFGRMSQSSRSSTTSTSSRKTQEELDLEDEDEKLPEGARSRNLDEHQDTLSDESGYSEESSPVERREHTGSGEAHPELEYLPAVSSQPLIDGECDLTVTGVMISDFSSAEKFRYLQKSMNNVQSADFLQNKVNEFCINI